MKKLLLAIAILTFISFKHAAIAGSDNEHQGHHPSSANGEASTEMKSENALKTLQDGIVSMEETISDKYREEMFADGPVMEKWHEKESAIRDAIELLKNNSPNLPDDKKKRLESSLNQLGKVLDDFHIATHNKDAAKAQSEVKKAKGALKLIQSNIK